MFISFARSAKLFVFAAFVLQFLFVNDAFSLDYSDERYLLGDSFYKGGTHDYPIDDGIEISKQARLWIFIKPENYLNDQRVSKQSRIYRYTFFVALTDANGNIIDSITELKKFDRHIYGIGPEREDTVFDLTGRDNLAYGFRIIFGLDRGSPETMRTDEKKTYSKFILIAVEKNKIKKVIDNLTVSSDEFFSDRVEEFSLFSPSLANQKTNGYFDFVFDKDSSNGYATIKSSEIFKFDGKLYRNVNTAVVETDKAVLFDSPQNKQSKMYLVKGDYVVIRDRKIMENTEWILVDYDSQALGKTLSKWMKASDIVPLFHN